MALEPLLLRQEAMSEGEVDVEPVEKGDEVIVRDIVPGGVIGLGR